jgi:putative nucleotidyltransferase with HDIG domain
MTWFGMSFRPNLEEQELLADTFRRAAQRLVSRELACEIVAGAGFLVAVAALWLAEPPGHFAVVPALLCLLVLVVATKVRFETPLGFTVATQLAFVPLVFALPGPLVPLAVVAALVISRLPQVASGRVPAERLLRALPNSWFAIGPVAVFAIAHTSPRDAGAGLLIVALCGQLGVDFAVSTARMAVERGADLVTRLRESWIYVIDIALSGIALVVGEDLHRVPIAALAPLPLLALLAMFAHERHARIESLLELNTAYRGTALVLGDMIEADDGYTGEHCQSVVRLALALAEEFGMDAEQRRNVEFAALLHDVGKIAIPKEIINKPGKLTTEEWTIIETHTLEGQRMLDLIGGFMHRVGLIVRSHHERWDGSGYPDGLAGDAIPIEARVITCCDSWNAMRTDRVYRNALSFEVARAELLANAGTQFDPHVVEVFLSVLGKIGEAPGSAAAGSAAAQAMIDIPRRLPAPEPSPAASRT